jgi:hypothetical protein
MINIENNTWEETGTLIHDDTIYISVWLEILSDGTWYNFNDKRIEFDVIAADNGGNGNGNGENGNGNGGNGSNDTPGFELIILVISILIGISIYSKKRIR